MKREAGSIDVETLGKIFETLDFPEYQREPNIWSREQKQRLIDSILRRFDISAIYFYVRDDQVLECIDGRQRLNAIASFLGKNQIDEDNAFPIRIENEIVEETNNPFQELQGRTFEDLNDTDATPLAVDARQRVLEYELTVVYLSGVRDAEEFNLQFLRLNLGSLINAGEKLHAMVGAMRDLVFVSTRIGMHPFFDLLSIPTRRYAKEQTAAQILLQIIAKGESDGFARARHLDLQRFLKNNAELDVDRAEATHDEDDEVRLDLIDQLEKTLDALATAFSEDKGLFRSRAFVVSLVIAAWSLDLYEPSHSSELDNFAEFVRVLLARLRWQVKNMREFNVNPHYAYLVDFQRHLTQAAVEKPAVKARHDFMVDTFQQWSQGGNLLPGDAPYTAETGDPPPVL